MGSWLETHPFSWTQQLESPAEKGQQACSRIWAKKIFAFIFILFSRGTLCTAQKKAFLCFGLIAVSNTKEHQSGFAVARCNVHLLCEWCKMLVTFDTKKVLWVHQGFSGSSARINRWFCVLFLDFFANVLFWLLKCICFRTLPQSCPKERIFVQIPCVLVYSQLVPLSTVTSPGSQLWSEAQLLFFCPFWIFFSRGYLLN